MNALLNWLAEVSGATIYWQHAICLTNDPILMTLYVAGDMMTCLSYLVIGSTLLVYRAQTLRFSTSALALYGTFIVLCGLSHASKTLTLFTGAYRLDVLIVVATASVSVITAIFTALNLGHSVATSAEFT